MKNLTSRDFLYWKIQLAINVFGSFVLFDLMDWSITLWAVYAIGSIATLLLVTPDKHVKERLALLFKEHDDLKDEIAKARSEITRLKALEFEAVMDKLGFTASRLERCPGKHLVRYAGKYANLTDAEIMVFGTEHEKFFSGSGEVLLYL